LKDTFKTIIIPSEEVLFKEKNSKFFGYSFPINNEAAVKPIIEELKKKLPNAGHFCYAYQIGVENIQYRANDDGEPNNSAGLPIYGQIQSFDVTNILIVVARIYGGTKLGVSGLIAAYKETAKLALENSKIIEKTIDVHYIITFSYQKINKVMRLIKEKNITIISQKMNETCEIEIATRKKNAQETFDIFHSIFDVEISEKK
jgi:uncharacterized YigZ family protein